MIIRPEQPADAAAIRAVLKAAFPGPDEARLVDRLRRDGDVELSLVAADGGAIVGHVLFSRMDAPFPALGLAPVSVVPERQRQGIGGALIRDGLSRIRRAAWRGVFVLGEPAYYRRFGFDPAAARGFTSPYAGPYLMALSLDGAALPVSTGPVSYAPAFAACEDGGEGRDAPLQRPAAPGGGTVLRLRRLDRSGLDPLVAALEDAGLPHEDVREAGRRFYSAGEGGEAGAFVGLEIYGRDALLRSLVVLPHRRGHGIGRTLVAALAAEAWGSGVERLWLLTTDAADFFAGLGFRPASRETAPAAIRASHEFRDLCPASAALMKLDLTRDHP